MAAAHDVEALLAQLGSRAKVRVSCGDDATSPHALSLSWPELDAVLPDGGLPRGVVELAAPRALGGSTSVALAAIRAGQARGASAWCAWLDPEGTLHAPGVVASGVTLARMLVVRFPRPQLGRVAVKVVASGAFEVVVVDFDAVPGAAGALVRGGGSSERVVAARPGARRKVASAEQSHERIETRPRKRGEAVAVHKQWAPEVLVRKLALAAEPTGATVLLLTDASKPRAVPWPVSLRVELSRPSQRELVVRVAKDKRGRIGVAKIIPFCPMPHAAV